MIDSLRLVIRVTPRAGRDVVEGWSRDDKGRAYLRIRTTAPPVDGAANAAIVKLISKSLDVPGRAVRVASGGRARMKILTIEEVSEADLFRVFGKPD